MYQEVELDMREFTQLIEGTADNCAHHEGTVMAKGAQMSKLCVPDGGQ